MKITVNRSWIGVDLIIPVRHNDNRGFFSEIYNYKRYYDQGIKTKFVQDNQSLSIKAGTIRGLHFQAPPNAQAKLIRCGNGSIFDVAVDIRLGSPYFGKWIGFELSAKNGKQLYIPIGFAHGFMTLEPNSEIIYKCSDYYSPKSEGVLNWKDPDINISWPKNQKYLLNERDKNAISLRNLESPFKLSQIS